MPLFASSLIHPVTENPFDFLRFLFSFLERAEMERGLSSKKRRVENQIPPPIESTPGGRLWGNPTGYRKWMLAHSRQNEPWCFGLVDVIKSRFGLLQQWEEGPEIHVSDVSVVLAGWLVCTIPLELIAHGRAEHCWIWCQYKMHS